jgi:hypothetical protein
MFVVTVLVYLIAWRRQAGIYTSTLLVMAAFVGLNSVFFMSYVLWVIPFIPFVMCDLADRGRPNNQLLRNPIT